MFQNNKLNINRHLFYETSHSPSLCDIVGEEMLSKVIDFCFIANPYYPTKEITKKLQQRLPTLIKSYPSSNSKIAQQHLGAVLGVNPDYLIIGNGATELITLIQKELIHSLAIPIPTFSEYTEKLRSEEQAYLYQLPAENNYELDLSEYAAWIDFKKLTSALIINPGNPTGQLLSLASMLEFLELMRHLEVIVVDESFIDFAGESIPSLLPHIQDYPNTIIVRSMSKHCGVPGLRLGYCCTANAHFLKRLRAVLPIWNINALAEFFITQLAETDEAYHVTRYRVIQDVRLLYSKLEKIPGFKVYPTGANFIMIKIECGLTATELQLKLLEEYQMYVRDCSNKIGLDNYHIRIASQGRKKDAFLIKALQKISNSLI